MKTILELSAEQLRKAAEIKDKILALETELERLLNHGQSGGSSSRGMSAAHRAKISAAMKKRWARASGKKTAESQSEQTKLGGGKKRTMSAAHKAQIAERMRAYWAKAKAEKKR